MPTPTRLPVVLALLVLLTLPLGAQGYQIRQWAGTQAGETLGWSVAIVGDVDQDGADDVLIGSPGATVNGQPNAGKAQLFSGMTGALIRTFVGTACCQYFGTAVAGAGDVNADGIPDLIVGAPAAGTGYVKVFSGAPNWPTLHTIFGNQLQDAYGCAVAAAGDVNGDGRSDFIVGARGTDIPFPSAGQVKVHSGFDGSVIHTFNGTGGFDTFGDSVANAGDVDGDFVPDIIAGATQPGFMATFPNGPGYARVHSGATGALLGTITSPGTNDFGYAVGGAGDVNLDGIADVVVTAPGAAGQATFFSGATPTAIHNLTGSPPTDHLGWAISRTGDLDLDGSPDQVVASPFFGGGAGVVRIHSGVTGGVIATLAPGLAAGANFGYSVSAMGDLDADGVPDVLVSAPVSFAGVGIATGEVRAYSFVGVPAGSTAVGAGCVSGITGFAPRVATSGGVPASTGNGLFAIHLSRGLPGSPALLIVGGSSTTWMGLPLPLPLGPVGMPSCTLYASGDILVPVTVGADGRAIVPVPIPVAPGLAGVVVFLQWYVVDPGPAPVPGTLSGAIQLSIP